MQLIYRGGLFKRRQHQPQPALDQPHPNPYQGLRYSRYGVGYTR